MTLYEPHKKKISPFGMRIQARASSQVERGGGLGASLAGGSPPGVLVLLALLGVFVGHGRAAPGETSSDLMCSALTESPLCRLDDSPRPSWCSTRNPYLIPRFLTEQDANTLGDLSRLSTPQCGVGGNLSESCYMFTRFMGTTVTDSSLQRHKVFVANVATNRSDTNLLLVLNAANLKVMDGWTPPVQFGVTYGDVALGEVKGGAKPTLIGALGVSKSQVVNRGEGFSKSFITAKFAPYMSQIVLRRPTRFLDKEQDWLTTIYFGPTSEYASLSQQVGSKRERTDTGGWWIWHEETPVFASLTKHRMFNVFRLTFSPSNLDSKDMDGSTKKNWEGTHIWQIDREPVSKEWALENCETDLNVLADNIFNSKACQAAVYPGTYFMVDKCPADCKALYIKYKLGDRRCLKYVHDMIAQFHNPSNDFSRALSQGMRLCDLGLEAEPSTNTLSVSFLEHSYGCEGVGNEDAAGVSLGTVFPSHDLPGIVDCGSRKRTIVVLSTDESIVTLEYAPPSAKTDGGGKAKAFDCNPGTNLGPNACYPSAYSPNRTCGSPCFAGSVNMKYGYTRHFLLSLEDRVRHISVETKPPVEGGGGIGKSICESCTNGLAIDNLDCVYWPEKVFTVAPGETISAVKIFSSRTTNPNSGKADAELTQQVWGVVAISGDDKSTNFRAFELNQFGIMTAADQGQVRPCNPVGTRRTGGVGNPNNIPVHSPPVVLSGTSPFDQSGKVRVYNTGVDQMTYSWQPPLEQVKQMTKLTNCSVWDRPCLIRTIMKKASTGGGGLSPEKIQKELSQLSQLQQSTPEGLTHILHASTNDRRLIVIYLHEVPSKCHAASMRASATIPGQRIVQGIQDSGVGYDQNELFVKVVNELALAGTAQHIETSRNGQFMFVTMNRLKTEIDSMNRATLMCKLLSERPDDPFLAPYKASCSPDDESMKPRKPNILDFVQVATLCMPGTLCPTFSDEADLMAIPPGNYSNYGYDQQPCKAGTFCAQGVQQECPIGFICPTSGMVSPYPCQIDPKHSTTCFDQRQIKPQKCPDGTICYTPYMPGLPAPPGYKTTSIDVATRSLIKCIEGEYCSIGRSETGGAHATLCPAAYYCENPKVPEPTFCTVPDKTCIAKLCPENQSCVDECGGMYSCPNGTVQEKICPAGRTCYDPRSPGIECPATSYCANGTFSAPPPCPKKFYCPTPDKKLPCPNHHFCPGGTIYPLKCGVMDFCPPSSSKKGTAAFALIIVFLLPFVCMGLIKWAYKMRDVNREKRNRRKELKRLSQQSFKSRKSEHKFDMEMSSTSDSSISAPKVSRTASGETKEGELTDALLDHGHSLSASEFEYMMGIDGGDEEDLYSNEDVFAPRKFRVDFEFKNLGLKLKSSGRSVLDGVTGKIQSAHITAVMGPSGAGKSTFVTTLAGKSYYGDTVGQILINGKERPLSDFKRVVGFVPQEDIMMRDLTVKENIWFSAQTRLPSNWTTKRKKQYRDATIEVLGLREIRHSPIGDENTRGISGGQRKRVNIALEMVADPLVLFLDEPTSGLDSTSSMEVCSALRKIADIGITVVTVLHQPRYEIFTQFHDVLLLGKGGRAVYLGPSEQALPYFEYHNFLCPDKVNPPDFMMDVIGGDGGDDQFHKMHPNFDPKVLFDLWTDHQEKQLLAEQQGLTSDFDKYLQSIGKSKRHGKPPVGTVAKHSKVGPQSHEPTFSENQTDTLSESTRVVLPDHDPSLEREITGRHQVSGYRLVWRFFKRASKQITRHWMDVGIDSGLLFLASGFMSYINLMVPWVELPPALPLDCYETQESNNLTACGVYADSGRTAIFGAGNSILTRCQMTVMAVGLCTCASSIKVFGRERVVYWREAAGLAQPTHSIAYFIGKDLAMLPQQVLGPLLYALIFSAMSANLGDFGNLYLVLFGVTFVSYSIGYIVSISVPASLSQLVGVVIIFCMSAFDGALPTIPTLKTSLFPLNFGFWHLSFLTPALRSLYVNEAVKWDGVVESARIDMTKFSREQLDFGTFEEEFTPAVLTLFAWGVGFRLAGVLLMIFKDRNKKL